MVSASRVEVAENKNVEPAVIVVIEERHAAADGLEDVVFVVCRAVDSRHTQPSLESDIGEVREKGDAGRFPARSCLHTARGYALRIRRERREQWRHCRKPSAARPFEGLHDGCPGRWRSIFDSEN